jgi:hypothetical protein
MDEKSRGKKTPAASANNKVSGKIVATKFDRTTVDVYW